MHPRRLSRFFIHLLWPLPFISFLCGYQLLTWVYGTSSIEAPSLVGKTLPEALQIVSTTNLNPRLIGHKEEADLPDGTILSQTPLAQTKIKPNQSIFFVVSSKPALIKTPLLINKSAHTIAEETKHRGIRTKTYFIDSPLPKDMCIGQWPMAGAPLTERQVILYLSSGNEKPVVLPNFKNTPVSTVTSFLNTHSIAATIFPAASHTCSSACIVTDQRPLAGSIITRDKPLTIQLQVTHH